MNKDSHNFDYVKDILHPDNISPLDQNIFVSGNNLKYKYSEYIDKNSTITLTEEYPNGLSVDYIINSHGFRSQPIENIKPESMNIVFSGCSWTHGSSLPDEHVWRSVLVKKFKDRFPDRDIQQYNFGVGGGSISLACKNVLSFLRTGAPVDYVYLLLPGFDRSTGFQDGDDPEMIKLFTAPPDSKLFKNKKIKEYTKNYNEIESIYHNMILLQSLIDICKLKKIKLFFGTWDYSVKYVYDYMMLDGYCDIPNWIIDEIKDDSLNSIAADGIHPGIDHMSKIANAFYEESFKP
jgi:hypothetical protein